jgi:medium-chain acyl-[acyl-carrier-protein] hydrolase
LICLPYAGGSAATYVSWSRHLPADVELIAVQPPGRGARTGEAPYSEMQPLVAELLSVFPEVIDRPYLLFGHSLGSRVAFELALQCQDRGWPLPIAFIASGSRAAHLPKSVDPIHDLPEAEFVAELRELNGTPEEVLGNEELLQLLIPLLRADFKIAELYCSAPRRLDCPIVVLAGTDDHDVSREDLEAWRALTTRDCEIHWIPGDHFFIEQNRALVLDKVNAIMARTQVRLPLRSMPRFARYDI